VQRYDGKFCHFALIDTYQHLMSLIFRIFAKKSTI